MKKLLLLTLIALGIPALSNAADISLTASDGIGTTSFNTGLHWSDATAPSAANDYFVGDYIFRTPPDGGSHTFGGNSLTISNVTGYPQGILYKGTGSAGTITINNLILDGGLISHANGSGDICRIAGNINVLSPSRIDNKQGPIFIDAALSGTGTLTNANRDNADRTTTYTADNSAFTGRMVIADSNCRVTITNENNLGGNPASFTSNQLLVENGWLQTGISNDVVLDDSNRGISIALFGSWSINPQQGSSLTIACPITGAGQLHKRGPGVLTLSGNNNLSGGVRLGAYSAGSQLNINSANALGYGIFTINNDGNQPTIDNTSGSDLTAATVTQQDWNRSFTFLGSTNLRIGGSAGFVNLGANVTATISNNTLTVDGIYDDATGGRSLTKNGPGTLTVDGGALYAGDTIVNEGTLELITYGILSTSNNIVVASNATLDVSGPGLALSKGQTLSGRGTVVGNVSDGGVGMTAISPGTSPGTLTIDGGLALTGGTTLNFELVPTPTVGGGTNDLIAVTGQLNLGGSPGATTLSILGVTGSGVTYTLFQYGSFIGDVANVSVPAGFILTNNTSTKTIDLIASHVPVSLTWVGDGSLNTWDIGITPNWTAGATFFNTDTVTFDDSGDNTVPVSLASDVAPASVTVNAAQNYTLTGSGIVFGSLAKSGNGLLVLDNTNTYSGATVINGGTLQVGDSSGAYGGTTFGVAGTIGTGPVTNNGVLQFDRNGGANLTIATNIEGSGSIANIGLGGGVTLAGDVSGSTVTMAGDGDMTLSGSNSYSGLTTVSSGRLFPHNPDALGLDTAGTVVASGAELYIAQNIDFTNNEALSLGGTLRKGGGGPTTWTAAVALTDTPTLSVDGGATLSLTSSGGLSGTDVALTLTGGGTGNIPGPISLGNGALTNLGGTWNLAGNNVYTGKTYLNGGTLVISSLAALGTDPGVATPDFVTFNGGVLAVTNDLTFSGGNRGLTVATNGSLSVQDAGATLTVSSDLNGSGNFTKRGPGTLLLTGSNPFAGNFYLDRNSFGDADGFTRLASPTALANVPVTPGTPTVIQRNNNAGWSTLQLDASGGAITLAQTMSLTCRNNDNPNIQNVSGNNTLSGQIQLEVGGNRVIFQSDAGLLTLSGSQQYVGGLTGGRTYTFAGAGDILVSGVINNSTNGAPISVVKRGTGTTTLSAANTYDNTTTISEGVLEISGSISSSGGVFVTGGALAGNGTVSSSVTVNSSSPSGTIDTYGVAGSYTIDGSLTVDVDRNGGSPLSDQPIVLGALTNVGIGTIVVNNLGAALQVGDTFTLFTKPIQGGAAMGVAGAGVVWSNNGGNGTITVVSTTVPQPQIDTFSVSASNVVMSGSGGAPGSPFSQLSTTNLSDPLPWPVLSSGFFDGSGNFNVTNAVNPAEPTRFYLISIP